MKSFLTYLFLFVLTCSKFGELSGAIQNDEALDKNNFIQVESNYESNFDHLINIGNCAYKVGFFDLSKKFFTQAFNVKKISSEQRCVALTGLLEACLATGDFSEATDKFDAVSKFINSEAQSSEIQPYLINRFLIHASVVACFKGDFSSANKFLLKTDIRFLKESDIVWYYTSKGILSLAAGNFEEMVRNIDEANKFSTSVDQSAQIQALAIQFVLKMKPKQSDFNNLIATASSLSQKYKFQKSGYPFVKANAILLISSGNKQKAKDLLSEQISNIKQSDIQNLYTFKLYYSLADGLHTKNGYDTVISILQSNVNDELKKQALKLLVSTAENSSQRINAFEALSIKELKHAKKKIIRQILLTKMMLAIDANNLELAQKTTEELNLEFPKDTIIKNIYEALAYIACAQDPRDYRMAAHYFGKMRDIASNDKEKSLIIIRIGNAFYLSGAYDIASHAYEEVLKSKFDGINYEKILCQLVQADIKLSKLESAEKHLQDFRNEHNSYAEYRWHAELLYINALINSEKQDTAISYLSKLLDTYTNKIQSFYLIKFYLLQSASMFSNGNYNRAYLLSSNICEIFPSKNSSFEIAKVVSQALFIKGSCELKFNNRAAATETFRELRKNYSEHEASMLSYFEEADYVYRNNDKLEACEILLNCAKSDFKYAPLAYYKAAEYYKSIGATHYDNAISCLSSLISKYGSHEIVYAARLEIADILRMSGRFSDAQLVYDELLKEFQFDKRYYFTEFCLAKTIFAQKSKGESFSERAQMILERLYSVASIDRSLHIEIAAMYCFVLDSMSLTEDMRKIAWETLLETMTNESQLTNANIYWLLQISNFLNNSYSGEYSNIEIETLAEITNRLLNIQNTNPK